MSDEDTTSFPAATRTILTGDRRPAPAAGGAALTGSSRGLMIGVLSAVVILLVALIVIASWMAQRAYHAASGASSRPRVVIERSQPSEPARSAGSLNPADWITADDYPAEALRNNEEGTVRIAWSVSAEGRVRDCHVEQSSGYASLDTAACRAITRSGRYPPVAAAGPTRTFSRRVVWKIP